MERIRKKMEEAVRQRKRLQANSDVTAESRQASRRPAFTLGNFYQQFPKSHIISLLLGCAAGVAITAIIWRAKPAETYSKSNVLLPESAEVVPMSRIDKTSDDIARLAKRIELLTETIIGMEDKLTRTLALGDGNADSESNVKEDKPAIQKTGPQASGVIARGPGAERIFNPTHTVSAKLNLRPSPSLSTKPITVLKIGSKVEFIRESNGWYYVHTKVYGNGWCSSDYLTPLLAAQHKKGSN